MIKNPYPGKFIVFEGLDGSGQSTQTRLLKDFLTKKGYQVVSTKEPTFSSKAGKKIRAILKRAVDVRAQQLQKLFAQDRKEHLEKLIIPALKEGKIVISDRYFFSSFAYGRASGLNLKWLIKINDEFLLPDITFLLKVSPKICLERIKKRKRKKTLFEEKEILEEVWKNYQKLTKKFGSIYVINGEKARDKVFKEIKKIIEAKLLS